MVYLSKYQQIYVVLFWAPHRGYQPSFFLYTFQTSSCLPAMPENKPTRKKRIFETAFLKSAR